MPQLKIKNYENYGIIKNYGIKKLLFKIKKNDLNENFHEKNKNKQ